MPPNPLFCTPRLVARHLGLVIIPNGQNGQTINIRHIVSRDHPMVPMEMFSGHGKFPLERIFDACQMEQKTTFGQTNYDLWHASSFKFSKKNYFKLINTERYYISCFLCSTLDLNHNIFSFCYLDKIILWNSVTFGI